MKKLLPFLKPYRVYAVIAPLFKFLEAVFELLVPVIMAEVIDVGVKNNDKEYILLRGLLLAALGLIGLVCSLTAQFFSAKAAMGFGKDLRNALFDHVLTLPRQETDKTGSAALISRITSDVDQVQSGVNLFLRLFLRTPFIVLGAIVMAMLIDLKMSLIFLIVSFLIGLVIFLVVKGSMPINAAIRSTFDKLTRKTRENLTGVRVIRAFSREEEEKEELFGVNEGMLTLQLRRSRLDSLLNPLTYVILNLAVVAVLMTGSVRVNIGELTQGEVIAMVNYLTKILIAIVAMANFIIVMAKAVTSASRIETVFEAKDTMPRAGTEKEKKDESVVLSAENLSFRYHEAGGNALDKIGFSLGKGESLGIIGGTGAGKTTLLCLIDRFFDPESGRILLYGNDLKEIPDDVLKKEIVLVSQKASLFSGTIRDNLSLGNPDADEETLIDCLKKAEAWEFVEPLGLDGMLTEGGANLSGGQKQRLSIARALAANPGILLLDDSFSALDFATEAKVRASLLSLKDRLVPIIVAQRLSSVADCDKILFLDDGRQIAFGTHAELFASCPQYRLLCEMQSKKEVG